ncbi:MAG: hypothetical protein JWR14_6898 [Caballeronia sp.]|jgi:hypothetical protein|nr:hypothetical protein [Caballeronia sp.]
MLSAIAARTALIDQHHQRVSGRQWHRDSRMKAARFLSVCWRSAHPRCVVSWSNIDSTCTESCCATRQLSENGSNKINLHVQCRSAERDSQRVRTRSIATNGQTAKRPRFAPRGVQQSARHTCSPYLKSAQPDRCQSVGDAIQLYNCLTKHPYAKARTSLRTPDPAQTPPLKVTEGKRDDHVREIH